MQSGHAVDNGNQIVPGAVTTGNSGTEKEATEPSIPDTNGSKEKEEPTPANTATMTKTTATGGRFVEQLPGNMTSAQLDNLCLNRAIARVTVTEQDITSVIGRVKGAMDQFSQFMRRMGTPAKLQKSGEIGSVSTTTTASPQVTDKAEDSDLVIDVISVNNKTVGSGEDVGADLEKLKAELEEISRQAEKGSAVVGSKERRTTSPTLQSMEKVGQVLAQAVTSLSQIVARLIDA